MPPSRKQQRTAALLDRLAKYKFDHDFNKALREAAKGSPAALCELLRSPNPPLTGNNLESLADLIERRLQAKARGRPRGSILMNPRQEAEMQIARMARLDLDRLRKRAGNKPLPRGTIDRVINKPADQLGEIHDGDVPELADVSFENIRNAVTRGVRRKPNAH
jgi:hypothetical protein